jgi:hypothetical protein
MAIIEVNKNKNKKQMLQPESSYLVKKCLEQSSNDGTEY